MIVYSKQQQLGRETKAPKGKLLDSEIASIGITKEECEETLRILRNLNRREEESDD